jgi:hypothetical protein
MPILVALLGIIATAYIWALRANAAKDVLSDLGNMAGDVKAAARRFGFSRKLNLHPVESIEDPNIAAAAIADAFVALDDMPSKEQQAALKLSLGNVLQVGPKGAEELMILGHWMVNECGGPQPAIARITKKLYRLEGSDAITPLMQIIDGVTGEGAQSLSIHQSEAIDEIKQALRIR